MSPQEQLPDCSAASISPKDLDEDVALTLGLNCNSALRWDAVMSKDWEKNESGLGRLPVFKIILNVLIFYAAF